STVTEAPGPHVNRLLVRSGERVMVVDVASIDWIEASGNYVAINREGERLVMRSTMKSIEESLPPRLFLRVNRSSLVNLRRVVEVRTTDPGVNQVVVGRGIALRLTMSMREFEQRLRYASG
ncbi:MAG TPA: LytTR family DNA-binding domain-containing protein, partial [Steroidobacteraceae bacterium]|nr:LytTR family DNA-binding domain-containing protein [Steroidobacteraceae bacterium]